MAVTNMIKAANSPVHSQPSSFFSLRGIFSCCYGKGVQNKKEEHPFAGEDSDDSDEEVRANFARLQKSHDTVDGQASETGNNSILSHASASIARSLHGTIFESKASKSVVKGDGQSVVSGKSVPGTTKSVVSLTGKSAVSMDENSVVTGTGKSVVSGIGKSVVSGTVITQGSEEDSLLKEEIVTDSSEHLSDASSITQYSEEYGDAPQGLTNLSDLSDEDNKIAEKDGDVRPTGRVSTLGVLSIGVMYEAKKARLSIRVREARDIPDPSQGGTTSYQLHLVLLPERRQRHKTKLRLASHLTFEETFVFTRVSPSTVGDHALRVRLYGCERRRRERLVAETVVALSTFGLQSEEKMFDIPLEPRTKLKSRKFVAELQPLVIQRTDISDSCPSTPNTPNK